MKVDGKTRLIGLIGNPVEHTLSPVIHNGLSEKADISSVYVPFKVEKEGLAEAVKGAYELNILGLNVTVPYKNQVMESLAGIDEAARQIGAVNTLVRDEELHGYIGYNTDMMGLKRQIKEDGIELTGQTVVILGAGGAAKAVLYMCLKERPEKIYLLNRTREKAESVAGDMNHAFSCETVVPMALTEYEKISEDNLVVFQATSIGLAPNEDQVVLNDPVFYRKVRIGVDLIYNPADTKFMRLVTKYGGKAYNALKMLLYQGVAAYELWHGIKVSRNTAEDIYLELKRKVYPKDNIVLTGFMGSGKTTVGRELAKRLGMDFLDTDVYIENRTGKSIPAIFAEEGEEAFRKLETETLMYLRNTVSNTVFSTGGGMPLREENARLLKEIGTVYYLAAAPSVIYDRVKDNTDRPLLQGPEPYQRICQLMRQRKSLYERASDVVIDTNFNDLEEIMETIVTYWKTEGDDRI